MRLDQSTIPPDARPPDDDPSAVRMTIGEHLDELRGCLVRSLLALVGACLLCIWPSKFILEIIARPFVIAQKHHGQPTTFLLTSPTEAFLIYVKVVIVAGLILSGPYILYQFWSFIGAGLYRNEKKWVYRLIPVSAGLFFVGVAFMYLFVLLVCLNFLIGFGQWLPMPPTDLLPWEAAIMGASPSSQPASQPVASMPTVPIFAADPTAPAAGSLWFNSVDSKLKLHSGAQTYYLQLQSGGHSSLVTTHFRLDEYISFFLVMTIAFGAAFQMPLVVYFLVRTGIVPAATMRAYRKVVILGIVIVAGILAPPDLMSHLLLSGPMILLFELGLLVAGRDKPRKPASA